MTTFESTDYCSLYIDGSNQRSSSRDGRWSRYAGALAFSAFTSISDHLQAIPVLVHAMEGLTNELEQLNRLFIMIPDLIDAATKLDNTLRTAQSAMVAANGLATTEAHIDPLSPMPTSSGDGHYGAHALPRSGSTGIVDSAGPPVHPIRAASPSSTHSGDAGGPPGSPSPAPSHAGDTER